MTAAAFIDAGGTLTPIPTLISFIHFYGGEPATHIDEMQQKLAAGASRKVVNEDYYRAFAGELWSDVQQAGYRWFAENNTGSFYRPEMLERIHAHKTLGDRIVLVSGSWSVCLDPIVQDMQVTDVLCSRPIIDHEGTLTGELERVMIAEGKSEAINEYAAAHGLRLADCAAYGDDVSDLEMMEIVGHPVAISGYGLDKIAVERGWELIVPQPGSESIWGAGVG